jgi:folate-binding protein YgfZ
LLLETERARRDDFAKRLSLYKLRSRVGIRSADQLQAFAIIGDEAAAIFGLPSEAGAVRPFAGGMVMVDPRLAEAGLRAWLPVGAEALLCDIGLSPAECDLWDRHRIGLGLPDGSRDLVPDKAILLENGFDELNGVDWQKGCYLGQELTARTKYRGLVRKRLLPVDIDGPPPGPGTPLLFGQAEAGEMRSHAGNRGLAMIRLEILDQLGADGGRLRAGDTRLTPRKPAWAVF